MKIQKECALYIALPDGLSKQQSKAHKLIRAIESLDLSLDIRVMYIKMSSDLYYSNKLLLDICGILKRVINRGNCKEMTLEITPQASLASYTRIWKEVGVNRIIIADQYEAPYTIKQVTQDSIDTFCNVGIDIQLDKYKNSDRVSTLLHMLKNVSFTHCTLECIGIFSEWKIALYQTIKECLLLLGFEQYEMFNFAPPGYQSEYMNHLWDQKRVIGLGHGAESYDEAEKNNLEKVNEYLMLNLRRKKGIDYRRLMNSIDQDKQQHYENNLNLLFSKGLISRGGNGHSMVLTDKGLLLETTILKTLCV